MKNGDYYSAQKISERRRIRRRKIFIRRLVLFIISLSFIVMVIGTGVLVYKAFNPDAFGDSGLSRIFSKDETKNVELAKELKMPEWVDVQLIHKHTTARTGTELTDIKNIVVHYVGNPGTTAQNNRDYFDKSDTTVSSHFVVGIDGEIIQCVPLYEKSAASNDRNKDTISVEVCHPDESGRYSDATYKSLIKLLTFLCENFSLDEQQIIRHYDITGKICPKYYVEHEDAWENLKEDVKEKLDD